AYPSRVKQPIGEDVSAVRVGRELDLVHRQEIHIEIARHGFDGADVIPWIFGLDLFLARNERNVARADAGNDLVVDFPRQKPERQSYKAALMPQHPLDCEMRFSGIR